MSSWGGGGVQIAWPAAVTSTACQIEANKVRAQAINTNPFTLQQEIQDWQASIWELSVQLPPMDGNDGQNWMYWFDNLNGVVNVFQFPSTFVTDTRFNYFMTYDGTHSWWWRMKSPNSKTIIKDGALFYITFECRMAI